MYDILNEIEKQALNILLDNNCEMSVDAFWKTAVTEHQVKQADMYYCMRSLLLVKGFIKRDVVLGVPFYFLTQEGYVVFIQQQKAEAETVRYAFKRHEESRRARFRESYFNAFHQQVRDDRARDAALLWSLGIRVDDDLWLVSGRDRRKDKQPSER